MEIRKKTIRGDDVENRKERRHVRQRKVTERGVDSEE
jgi:hypothetical protein